MLDWLLGVHIIQAVVPGLSNGNSEGRGVALMILVTLIRRQCDIMKPFHCVKKKIGQLGEC